LKQKTLYVCNSCGNEFSKWAGQCSACNEWNTLKEFKLSNAELKVGKKGEQSKQFSLTDIALGEGTTRVVSGIEEFDRVLGGGIVPDSFVLLTGDPGVGKSTLALQVAMQISNNKKVLYISGEESVSQVTSRARRIDSSSISSGEDSVIPAEAGTHSSFNGTLRQAQGNTPSVISSDSREIPLGEKRDFSTTPSPTERKRTSVEMTGKNIHFTSENNLENIFATLEKSDLDFVVIDSIQTIHSDTLPAVAGSASQVRFCAESLMQFIKNKGFACVLIGHVTKDGNLAGPQTLAHLVDTVLYLEGDKYHQFRMLRGQKNRFGSTSEIGVFEMQGEGLCEVKNPSAAFLEGRMDDAEGSVIIPLIEGTRPFLIELQALTAFTNFGYPKRTASGVDMNRLHLMLAVLQKHGNEKLDNTDVFVNVVGGFRISEPAADLGLLLAVASSKLKKSLKNTMVVLGEVGLSGEVRAVSHIERRLQEAEKMGFDSAIIPFIKKAPKTKLKLVMVKTVREALKQL
jgi:DNA repair protein RadA/Sms